IRDEFVQKVLSAEMMGQTKKLADDCRNQSTYKIGDEEIETTGKVAAKKSKGIHATNIYSKRKQKE
ncbi:MAG: hypothetical protein MI744_19895, partial [Pseudomonadales bacterium]|nr:hypothetical protein [Pseudomonadales bacterium]